MRARCVAACAVSILVICCGGGPSLEDYATRGEQLTTRLISRVATLDAELESRKLTPEAVQDYWDQRLAARVEFLDGIRNLDPPSGLVDLHEMALDLFSSLVDAERALAARVAESETAIGPSEWWSTPEGEAARGVDQEAIAICHAAQARFDATRERETLDGLPWIPSEMKESVRVAFGCP